MENDLKQRNGNKLIYSKIAFRSNERYANLLLTSRYNNRSSFRMIQRSTWLNRSRTKFCANFCHPKLTNDKLSPLINYFSVSFLHTLWNDSSAKLTKLSKAKMYFSLNNSRKIQMLKNGQEAACIDDGSLPSQKV